MCEHILLADTFRNETRAVARIRWRFAPPGQADATERETVEIVRIEGGQAVEHWGAEAWSRTLPRAMVLQAVEADSRFWRLPLNGQALDRAKWFSTGSRASQR